MGAGVTHTSVDKGEGRIRALIAEMQRTPRGPYVKAGVLEGAGNHLDPGGRDEGTPVAMVAYYVEFGTSHMPERAPMRMAARQLVPVMSELGAKLLGKMIDGSLTLDKALEQLGVKARDTIKRYVPVETGKYRDAVTFEKVK